MTGSRRWKGQRTRLEGRENVFMKIHLKKHHLALTALAVLVIIVFGVFMLIAVPEITTERIMSPTTQAK